MKKVLFYAIVAVLVLSIYSRLDASPLSIFNSSNGWTQFADDDGYRASDGKVFPGYGGQVFDAEHLFYKLQGTILSIGLQAGFNLDSGVILSGSRNYYAGDLALSFDGDAATYEYAADFGLFTKDYVTPNTVGGNTGNPGYDTAGIYGNIVWNNDVYGPYGVSNPFAMESGQLLSAFDSATNLNGAGSTPITSSGGFNYGGSSYYRIVSFSTYLIPEIGFGNPISLDAHWTMSCGNDAIDGSATTPPVVPEPGTMLLLGSLATGLFGLAGLRKRFTK